ncbi:hypothetical protein [Mycobacterium sp. 1164985.4]|uniref:hypothetical protein n=1 Tax=Mycobacterium sp. 1164985.4 TaxID=1834069 RepID=UPI000835BA8D|nr:hypothetical protein [Mycobacterium sp. 1164985.4]
MASDWWRQRYGGPPPTPAVVVCTGRGRHQRLVLLGVMVYTHSGLVEPAGQHYAPRVTGSGRLDVGEPANALRYVRVPRTGEQTPQALMASDAWEFSCPKCGSGATRTVAEYGRKPRVRKAEIAAAVRMGLDLDVSFRD